MGVGKNIKLAGTLYIPVSRMFDNSGHQAGDRVNRFPHYTEPVNSAASFQPAARDYNLYHGSEERYSSWQETESEFGNSNTPGAFKNVGATESGAFKNAGSTVQTSSSSTVQTGSANSSPVHPDIIKVRVAQNIQNIYLSGIMPDIRKIK